MRIVSEITSYLLLCSKVLNTMLIEIKFDIEPNRLADNLMDKTLSFVCTHP